MHVGGLVVLLLLAAEADAAGADASEADAADANAAGERTLVVRSLDGRTHQLVRGVPVRVASWSGYVLTGRVAGLRGGVLVLCSDGDGLKRIETGLIQSLELRSDAAELASLRSCLTRVRQGVPEAAPVQVPKPARVVPPENDLARERAAVARVLGDFEERLYRTYTRTAGHQSGSQTYHAYTKAWLERRSRSGYVLLSIGAALTAVGLGFGIAALAEDDAIEQFFFGLATPAFAAPGVVMLSIGSARVVKTGSQRDRLEAELRALDRGGAPPGVRVTGVGPLLDREGKVSGASLGFRF